MKHIFLLITAVFSINAAMGHAIWIESDAVGYKGQEHTVRIYYGEYETGELENTSDWYSDLKELEVHLLQPGQQRTTLTLVDKGNYLEGTFVPNTEGTYYLSTSHIAKELGGGTRYEFTSQVAVQVGNRATTNESMAFVISAVSGSHGKGKKVEVILSKDQQPIPNQEIVVMSPSGWSKKYRTDEKGAVHVEGLWKGTYVIEYSHSQKVEGIWADQPYTATWQAITTSFEVH